MSEQAGQLTPRQVLAQGLAKRRGISPEEAEAIIATVQKQGDDDKVRTFMRDVSENAATLRTLPPDTREAALQYMAGASGRGAGDDMVELKKMLREVTIIKEALRPEQQNNQPNEALMKQLDDLNKKVETFKEEQAAKRFADFEKTVGDKLTGIENDLKEQLAAAGAPNPDDGVHPITKVVEDLKAFKEAGDSLRDVLGIKETAPSRTIAEQLEDIRRLGYKVEGPKTLEQIEKEIDERIKAATEAARKETEAKLKSDEKKMAMLVDLGTSVLDGVLPVLAEGSGKNALATAKNALKAAPEGT